MIKKIALTGPAGSGKDEIAEVLCNACGFQRIALADPIKKMLVAGGFCSEDDLSSRDRKEETLPLIGKSPRQLMQTLATEWGRTHVDQDIWLKLALNRVRSIEHFASRYHTQGVVITDVRFNNEATWARQHGFVVVHVNRPDIQPVSELGVTRQLVDLTLDNNGTLEELGEKVIQLANHIEQGFYD